MESLHCAEENALLNLLKELQPILMQALNSLANQAVPSAESRYLGDAAKSVNIASDAFIMLRESGRVHASKLVVRPMIEAVLSAIAVLKKKGFLFRIAYTELSEMKKLYPKTPENEAAANANLEHLKKRFREKPGYPVVCKCVDMRYTAEVAGLVETYDMAYRIYCEFTHSTVRAVRGSLDQTTDPIDTSMVIWAVRTTLDHLKVFTPANIPDLAPFNERILLAQKAILRAWGHEAPCQS